MKIRILTAGVAAFALASTLVACSTDTGSTGGGSTEGQTLTYWASNQGSSLDNDAEVLQPELDKFEEQTGIKVNLEVLPWSDLTNNTLAAAVSGQGPDVLNIGNTNAVTFQSTGAFYEWDEDALAELGGEDHFVDTAFATAGAPGQPVTSVPLYSQVYALHYNKQMFADAGVEPPTTWEELVDAAKELTDPAAGVYGIAIPGGTVNVSMHLSFILGEQNGVSPFDEDGNADFTSQGMVDAVTRYVDLLAVHQVVNPSAAQYTEGAQAAGAFARGEAAMYFAQTGSDNVLAQNGMDADAWGIVRIPSPEGGDPVGSHVAGTNISIFKNTDNLEAAIEFVKFMTSEEEQGILPKSYTMLPAVQNVPVTFSDDQEKLDTWASILAENAEPLPLVPFVQAFQANVGGAVVGLIARAATGGTITEDDVRTALEEAQQKMGTAG